MKTTHSQYRIGLFILLLCMTTISEKAQGQSVLSKFKELNEIIRELPAKPSFTIGERGYVTIHEGKKRAYTFHFTDIAGADSLWEDQHFVLLLRMKENKQMKSLKRKVGKKRSDQYRMLFKDPRKGRKALAKLKESIEIGKPRSRLF